jgi:pyridoxal phosphate enzyme (YggS family)
VPDEGPAARIAAVRGLVQQAAERAGRDPGAVRIIAVTKTLPPEAARAALAAGLEDIGENYVQEARNKRRALGGEGNWHLIGGLQRNKVRTAVEVFDRLHTIDAPALAADLAREAARVGRRVPVLVQVNVSGDPRKRGVSPDGVESLARLIAELPPLQLDGLMTIGPQTGDSEVVRRCFRRLRDLRDDVQNGLGVELPHLSMGMSDDFVIAVEEGATLVRLGRALFGSRRPGTWREGA